MHTVSRMERRERLALAQGAYFVATGVWPIVHLRSFERVTGPKPEGWLVKTVGGVVTAVGAALIAAARNRRVTPEIELLAVGSSAALGAIDLFYGGIRRRISPVYLAEALLEAGLIAVWTTSRARRPLARRGMPVGWAEGASARA